MADADDRPGFRQAPPIDGPHGPIDVFFPVEKMSALLDLPVGENDLVLSVLERLRGATSPPG